MLLNGFSVYIFYLHTTEFVYLILTEIVKKYIKNGHKLTSQHDNILTNSTIIRHKFSIFLSYLKLFYLKGINLQPLTY